jgi:hypothetical protein
MPLIGRLLTWQERSAKVPEEDETKKQENNAQAAGAQYQQQD